jgi:hypothetical protein
LGVNAGGSCATSARRRRSAAIPHAPAPSPARVLGVLPHALSEGNLFQEDDAVAQGKSQMEKAWAEAKKRFRLSQEHVRMARELGMNPKKLGKLGNNKHE